MAFGKHRRRKNDPPRWDDLTPSPTEGHPVTVRTIEVKVDEKLHSRNPEPGTEEISWSALDTAWNLLRETAVRLVLHDLRTQATEQGLDFPATDEELFQAARDSGDPDAPTSYLDLAPDTEIAAMGLHSALQVLAQEASRECGQALRDAEEVE